MGLRARFGVVAALALCFAQMTAYADEPTVEQMLAVVQRNTYVAPDDPLTLRFGNLLDRLEYRCQETRLQLGSVDSALIAQLQQQGVYSVTNLSMLQDLERAVPLEMFGPDHPANCAEVMAILVTIAQD